MTATAVAADAVLGIDVGGTTVKWRLATSDGRVLAEDRLPTRAPDPNARLLAQDVVAVARAAGEHARFGAVGLAVPGIVDDHAGVGLLSVNMGWRDAAVADLARAALVEAGHDVPLAVVQDVRAGALAEAADLPDTEPADAHGADLCAFVPVGTGVAAALVRGGRPADPSPWAGEIGQVTIPSGPHAGLRVEDVASASAIARRGGAPDARAVADRVRAGDAVAAAAWADGVDVLAQSLAWLTAATGCDRVVVGGGLVGAGGLLLDPLRERLANHLSGWRVPRVTAARHGASAGVAGSVLVARGLRAPTTQGVPA